MTQRFYANLVNLLDMEADETAERGAEDVVRNDAGNDDRSATNSHESEFSDSDAEDAINRRKRCRRPLLSVPIGASALPGDRHLAVHGRTINNRYYHWQLHESLMYKRSSCGMWI